MHSAPDEKLTALTLAAARRLRALVTVAVVCLVAGLAGRAITPAAAWAHVIVLVGTGIVVAAPLATLVQIAWVAPTRRLAVLALLSLGLTAVGALLAR